ALKTCATLGFDGVELVAMTGWPCDPATLAPPARRELRERLADLDLELSGIMENLRVLADDKRHAENLDRLKRAAELARDLSPDRLPVIETVLGGKPGEWMQVRERMAERLRDWTRAVGDVTLSVKPHVGNALHR